MAPRAYWKGYLKLSLVSCPVALFPASSEREKISFHQLNKDTGNRIKYLKVDAETGQPAESDKIIKGYEVGKGQYIEVEPEELEAIAIESKRKQFAVDPRTAPERVLRRSSNMARDWMTTAIDRKRRQSNCPTEPCHANILHRSFGRRKAF